jgi:hypothetical protein
VSDWRRDATNQINLEFLRELDRLALWWDGLIDAIPDGDLKFASKEAAVEFSRGLFARWDEKVLAANARRVRRIKNLVCDA